LVEECRGALQRVLKSALSLAEEWVAGSVLALVLEWARALAPE